MRKHIPITLALAALLPAAWAQWPAKPIKIIAPSAVGMVRSMASRGADAGFLNAQLMGAFMAADVSKCKRVANFAKITLG